MSYELLYLGGMTLVCLGTFIAAWTFWMLENAAPPDERVHPGTFLTGLCVDCGYHRVLNQQGRCATCGSDSVMRTQHVR